jgi:hypothetical protein
MHMSLAGAANPFTATAAWRPNLHGEGHVLFLHLGDNLTLLMSSPSHLRSDGLTVVA